MHSALLSSVLVLATVSVARCLIVTPPQNDAVRVGSRVRLECEAASASPRVQWYEFITNPTSGSVISDNSLILPGHPNAGRYSIESPDNATIFNLVIDPVALTDGGTYRCQDTSDASAPAYLQLVTILADTNCSTNIPDTGYVREDQYYTVTCEVLYRGNAAPQMWWTLPVDQFYLTTTVTTNETVTSGIALNMSRWSSWDNFTCLTNFTERGFILPNSATNVPTWNHTYLTPTLIVQWEPKNMYIVPEQASYEIGDRLECHADANPEATYYIMNMDTLDRWPGFVLDITEDMVGSWRMACNAANNITGTQYTNNYFWILTVNPRTTTPLPTTTTTTAPPLPEDACDDLTGRWGAQVPQNVDMCLEVNNTNHGRIIGILRNASDPYFVEIRGRVAPNQFNQVGFTGVWPVNVGVVTWIGTCKKCYGVEKLQINAAIRRTNDAGATCGDLGPSYLSATYLFSRTGPPCRTTYGGQFEGVKVLKS